MSDSKIITSLNNFDKIQEHGFDWLFTNIVEKTYLNLYICLVEFTGSSIARSHCLEFNYTLQHMTHVMSYTHAVTISFAVFQTALCSITNNS